MDDLTCQYDKELLHIGYRFRLTDRHFYDRIGDRGIDECDVLSAATYICKNMLCRIIFECEKDDHDYIPFGIVVNKEFVIHGSKTVDELYKKITFRTITKYYEGYKEKQNGFLIYLNGNK